VLIDLVGSGNLIPMILTNTIPSSTRRSWSYWGTMLKDVVLVGHSVSAIIGALASIQNPAVFDCIIMIGPSPGI
jgi:pimeloyl-ACP methyl ester carboxylesterase